MRDSNSALLQFKIYSWYKIDVNTDMRHSPIFLVCKAQNPYPTTTSKF